VSDPRRGNDREALVGREIEAEQIRAAWQKASTGTTHVVLVSGPAGAGKTALVEAACAEMRGGFFVPVKFDRARPQNAHLVTVEELTRQILTEGRGALEAWNTELSRELGALGAVLCDLCPTLRLVLGAQPPPPELEPDLTKNRLDEAVVRFVTCCSSQAPLLLFYDDLQWGELPVLGLLARLHRSTEARRTLVVGTYRSDEVQVGGKLETLRAELRSVADQRLTEIELGNLSDAELTALVRSVLPLPEELASSLAEILRAKTDGNPLFFSRLLRHVGDLELIEFSQERDRWEYDAHKIRELEISENVVKFLIARLRTLRASDLALCQFAACLGGTFSLPDLERVTGHEDVTSACGRLQEQGVFGLDRAESESGQGRVGFQHDRVRDAVLATLSSEEEARLQLQIGRRLLDAHLSSEERLHHIVGHLNRGSGGITDPQELAQVRALNLQAAERALRATDAASALHYARRATPEDPEALWAEDPALAHRLYKARATAAYLTGDLTSAGESVDSALGQEGLSATERADMVGLSIVVLTLAAKYEKGLTGAKRALTHLESTLDPSETSSEGELLRSELLTRPIGEVVRAEPMMHVQQLAVARILASMLPLTFLGDPSLFPIVTHRAVRLAIAEGPTAPSAIAIAAYGILLVTEHRYDEAYDCGLNAVFLADRFGDLSQRSKAGEIFLAHLAHWKAPLVESSKIADEAHRAGLESGDLQYARYTRLYDAVNRFYAGARLPDLLAFCGEHHEEAVRSGCQISEDALAGELSIVRSLMSGEPLRADEAYLERCRENGSTLASCIYLVMKAEVLYRRGALTEALSALEEAAPQLAAAPGVITNAAHAFFLGLVSAGLAGQCDGHARLERVGRVRESALALARWAEHNPVDFHHQELLLRAELSFLEGEAHEALEAYDRAIEAAAKNAGSVRDQLLAIARCREVSRSLGLAALSDGLAHRQRKLRLVWGAHQTEPSPSTRELGYDEIVRRWGFSRILRLEDLLAKVVEAALGCGDADRCTLLLTDQGEHEFRVGAAESTEGPIPPSEFPDLAKAAPLRIVNYVARTSETVVVRAGRAPPAFASDPYLLGLEKNAVVLSMALQHKGIVHGVLSLERRGPPLDFSPTALGLLEVLCSQAATSLENALLFEEVRLEVAVRQRAEEELEFDRAKLAGILDIAGEGIVAADAAQEIVLFNKRAEEMFGYSAQEVLGQPLSLLLPPGLRSRHEAVVGELAASPSARRTARIEGFGCTKEGREVPVEVKISALRLADKQLFTAVVRDLTQTRAVEERRRRLVSELDHRVKNNLATITSLIKLTAESSNDLGEFVRTFSRG